MTSHLCWKFFSIVAVAVGSLTIQPGHAFGKGRVLPQLPPPPIQPYVVVWDWSAEAGGKGYGYFNVKNLPAPSNRFWAPGLVPLFPDDASPDTLVGPVYCADALAQKRCKSILLEKRPTYKVMSSCMPSEPSCYEGKPPVLLVHGYTPGTDAISGGGEDTWGDFPRLIEERGYVTFEFRWNTGTRFQEAAVELERAIDLIHSKTGRPVNVVAHSFGGVLVRTMLQGIHVAYEANEEHRGKMSQVISSVVTLGTPHSGIFDHVACGLWPTGYPDGQDPSAYAIEIFFGCGQLSCQQAGQIVKGVAANSYFFGVSSDPGEIAAELALTEGYPLPAVPFLSLIGITTWRDDDGVLVDEGDGLITFEGQRFHPSDSVSDASASGLCQESSLSLVDSGLRDAIRVGDAEVTEKILGFPSDARPTMPNPVPTSGGYRHNGLVCAAKSADLDNDCSQPQPPPEAYVVCASASECEHETVKEVLAWLPPAVPATVYRLTVTGTISYIQDNGLLYRLPITAALGDPITLYWDIDTSTQVQVSSTSVVWTDSVVAFGYQAAGASGEYAGTPEYGTVDVRLPGSYPPRYSILSTWPQSQSVYWEYWGLLQFDSPSGTSLESVSKLDPTPLSQWASSSARFLACPSAGICSGITVVPTSVSYVPLR